MMIEEKSVAFYTLGCKVNQQETESMRLLFREAGYALREFDEAAGVYVINTCTVTGVSDQKSRQAISRAHTRNPDAAVVVVGCYSQRAPDVVAKIPGVQLVVGTQYRNRIVELVENLHDRQSTVEDISKTRGFEALPAVTHGKRTRIQLKIQDGCDRYCAYCIIPYTRGPIRSLPSEGVKRELDALSAQGVGEVVLTGIHLMSYGKDLPDAAQLTSIITYGASLPGIGRIRLGSLEPALIDESFVKAIKSVEEGKLCRQFHLPLQSGSDAVLKRMKRRYTVQEFEKAAGLLHDAFPEGALTTDVIAGFPGETEEEHAQTMALVEQIAFSRLHVFPYSRREGTAASEMPQQVQNAVKQRRARELIDLGERLEQAYLEKQVGALLHVLPETYEQGMCEGYADNYVRVRYQGELDKGIQPVRISAVGNGFVQGEQVAPRTEE